ncbi:MAG: 6-bladed beta-propeller, partial [Vulcanimicrobiota bacterium]
YGISASSKGVLVTDAHKQKIIKFTSNLDYISSFGEAGTLEGRFMEPAALAVDHKGTLAVADPQLDYIQLFIPSETEMKTVFEEVHTETIISRASEKTQAQMVQKEYGIVNKWGTEGGNPGRLNQPQGVKTNSRGEIVLADSGNYRIQIFDLNGKYLRSWGSKGREEGQFEKPDSIAIDENDHIYVADSALGRISIFNPDGELQRFIGKPGNMAGQFSSLRSIAIDSNYVIYTLDGTLGAFCPYRIQKFDMEGRFLEKWELPQQEHKISRPVSMDFDEDDNLYILDQGSNQVLWFTPSGTYIKKWGSHGKDPCQFNQPSGIMVGKDGIFVTDTRNHRIQKFTSTGEPVCSFGKPGTLPGAFMKPVGIAMGPDKTIIIIDEQDNSVSLFQPGKAKELEVAKEDGLKSVEEIRNYSSNMISFQNTVKSYSFINRIGRPGMKDGQFNMPRQLALDSEDKIYVVDTKNHRIQKLSNSGEFITGFGTRGNQPGQFMNPTNIAITNKNEIAVTDSGLNRIQFFTSEGKFIKTLGKAGGGIGEFNNLRGIACDNSGYIYAIDGFNNPNSPGRVQKFDSDGNFIRKWDSNDFEKGILMAPADIVFDGEGSLFLLDPIAHSITRFTLDGQFIKKFGSMGNQPGQFRMLSSIAVNKYGIFVSEMANLRIQKFTFDGEFVTTWGERGPGDAQFMAPEGIAVDSEGKVFVVDSKTHSIQVFS